MEFVMRLLFFVAAVSFLVFVLTVAFSLFLIIWPFLAVGLLASIAYAWLAKYRYAKRGENQGETTIYRSEHTIIIEHEEPKENNDSKK
jgi:hypothetical protein